MSIARLFAVAALAWLAVAASPAGAQAGRALLLSDIHFDPLDDPTLLPALIAAPASRWSSILRTSERRSPSTYGNDTNYPLLQSALDGAAAAGPYDYVLYTGDALPHDFESAFTNAGGDARQFPAFALKAQLYLIERLQSRFAAPVYLALGNDDSDCGDYRLAPASPYLAETSRAIRVLARAPEARASFTRGGYYSLPHPVSPRQRIIVLNSVLWSTSYSSCRTTRPDPGTAQLDWLSSELAAARAAGHGVTLAMHVPGGMDAYASARQGQCAAVPLLQSAYTLRLAALLRAYADIVQVAFAGHTHMDDFRLPTVSSSEIPLKVIPAISPLFGNNPAFAILSYDRRNAAPLDFAGHVYDLSSDRPAWTREYRFTAAYGVAAFNRRGTSAAIGAIREGGTAFETYRDNYASGTPSPIDPTNARFYTCAQSSFSEEAYRTCLCAQGRDGGDQR